MKKQLPDKFEHTTLDGWVALAPGETMCECVDTAVSPTVAEQQQLMKAIRGGVLAGGFMIENNCIRLQLAHRFQTTDRSKGGAEYMKLEEYLRDDATGLGRRLEGVYPIAREMMAAQEAEKLIQDLAEFRRARNVCAHRPCWLKGIWDADAGTMEGAPKGRTTGYRLLIADATYQWEIDRDQISEWELLIGRVAYQVETLVRQILRIDAEGKPLLSTAAPT